MTASYEYDGGALTRVRRGSVELTQCAENLQVGAGRLTYDDTAGTLAIVGQMDFAADESACSNPITARGFIGPRGYSRQSERKALAREIDVEFQDLNAMAGFRRLRQKAGLTAAEAGKRPAETVAARGAWLMASPFVTGLFTDEGRCDFPADKGMDKADYRNQFPGDVLADMVLAALGYNAYIRDFGDGPELVFRNDNTSTADTIDLRISNVIADVTGDVGGLTFHPFKDAVLRRDPSQVISDLGYSHARGTANEERTATAAAFNGERGGTASNFNVKSAAKASDEAAEILWQRHTEEDTIECTIQVPASAVNLVNHGDRMQARFSHLTPEGYGSMTWFRVLECAKRPLLRPVGKYEVRLKLSPQEPAETFPAGYIVQSAFRNVGAGGGDLSLPNPVTIGNLLVYAVGDRVDPNPVQPNIETGRQNWGTGAWTRFNGATITDVGSGDPKHGCAMYYKIADSANQTGFTHATDANIGIWEVGGATVAGVTTAAIDETTGTPYDIGTLGTAAVGTVAIMVVIWDDHMTPLTGVTPSTGWTTRLYDGAYPHWAGPAGPRTWLGDALGAGAVLNPSVSTGVVKEYAGVAVLLPAL